MKKRKEMKRTARGVLKRHYWLFVVLCLLAAMFGTEFSSSLTILESTTEQRTEGVIVHSLGTQGMNEQFARILSELVRGNEKKGRELADRKIEKYVKDSKTDRTTALGRSRGVLSMVVNSLTSGAFLISLTVGIRSIVGSNSAAVMILIIGSLLFMFALWLWVYKLYQVIMRRMFLEGRCYEKVYAQRALFLLKVRQWLRAGITIFVMTVYETLWWFTIIGGIIKHYSYYLVPYIVAENPSMKAKEAITLSRELMKGHKWQCFVFELSFWGWKLLSALTAGLSGILYSNPYQIAAFSEYYAELRRLGIEKKVKYYELLNDQYLFEQASYEKLHETYADVVFENKKSAAMVSELKGVRKFLAKVFGLTIWSSKKEQAYEEEQAKILRMYYDKAALEGVIYPTRLSAIPEKQKRTWIGNINYFRCYSIWSVIMMFFLLSFGGWIWEVSLHLISDGEFVNRGVLHGPWLPIYGVGSVLILLVLNMFRRKPAAEFVLTMVLCGCVEYFTAYYLEMTHNGKKWWDYSGYFLNLDGRICAEGLLVFGVGGMMIVYVLAPLLDNVIRRIPYRRLVMLNLLLIGLFAIDQSYSAVHPNEGKGITNYSAFSSQPDQWKRVC